MTPEEQKELYENLDLLLSRLPKDSDNLFIETIKTIVNGAYIGDSTIYNTWARWHKQRL